MSPSRSRMNPADFHAQGSTSFVAGAALGDAIGTAANQGATYRDCMLAIGYTPQTSGDTAGDGASGPPRSCGGGLACPTHAPRVSDRHPKRLPMPQVLRSLKRPLSIISRSRH